MLNFLAVMNPTIRCFCYALFPSAGVLNKSERRRIARRRHRHQVQEKISFDFYAINR
ncbi:hypothetical protein [Nostoc sp.]|uniref:hypothetical protein n=1 Tax=Nostoc sp. TaxID=1180 RepID=UPI002FFD044E